MTALPPPPPSLPEPGAHGGDATRVAFALGLDPAQVIDLSASMNPFAPDVTAVLRDIVATAPHAVGRYPDPTAATTRLAGAIGVDPAALVLTNGGAEAIALVAAELGRGHVVEPEFSLYRRHLAAVEPDAPRWRSNPSNPLGTLAHAEERAGVWDEAFHPLATGRWTRGDADAWRLGSLTKLWACPGLRLGYVVAPDPAAALAIRRRQPQWAVNGLALAAVDELVARTDLARWYAGIVALRSTFVAHLAASGLRVRATDANWCLVEHDGLRHRLAPLGVVVRDCASFGLPGTHRVALPAEADLDRVLAAFATVAAHP